MTAQNLIFQSTLSVRRATRIAVRIHYPFRFQSTLSVRRATHETTDAFTLVGISIHALREESDPLTVNRYSSGHVISIHALREESDRQISPAAMQAIGISIHALREESDPTWLGDYNGDMTFQSTLSVRRATGLLFIH